MSLTPEGRGLRSVVRYCKLKGCRPIDVPGAPCSRCGTWQSYRNSTQACLRWHMDRIIEESYAEKEPIWARYTRPDL
jgi:hypothetical protein